MLQYVCACILAVTNLLPCEVFIRGGKVDMRACNVITPACSVYMRA